MEISLVGKKALVTGGSRGIGKEIVKTLVQAGAQVTVICILKDALEILKKEIPSVTIIHHDLSDWKKTETLLNSLPPMDLLVNNAGICDSQAIGSVTEENFDRVFAVNVKAVINVSQVMSKKMKESRIKGSIVNLASYTSQKIFPETVTYCTSKIAVDHITRALAKDLAPHGIRVNAVNPAVVNTDMGKQFSQIVDTGKVEKMPLNNRPIQPEEVAKPILFLLSDWASMISGETIRIDGCLFHE